MKKLIIIDTFGFFFRLYYAMMNLKSEDNKPSGMVFGFVKFIKSLDELNFDLIVFALDSKVKSFRNEIYKSYKANRSSPPQELKEQLLVCIEMIKKMGFKSISIDGFEADDIIASIVKKYKNKFDIEIFTHDKDLYQLIDTNVKIYSTSKKELYGELECKEKFGVYPKQIKDYLSLVGDSADNIPGVKGIGPKGAKDLLNEFNSLSEIFEHILDIRNPRLKSALINYKDDALLSYNLVSLRDDLDVGEIYDAKNVLDPLSKIVDILKSYSIKSEKPKNILEFKHILITTKKEFDEVLKDLDEKSVIAFDTETTDLDTKVAKIVGFSFAIDDKKGFYVPINHSYLGVSNQVSFDDAKEMIKKIFSFLVVGHNLKYDFEIVKNNFNINLPKRYIDTMLLAWLSNPSLPVGMDALAKRLFNYETIKFEDVVKKGENFSSVEIKKACKYSAEDAFITLKFYNYFKEYRKDIFELINFECEFIKVLINLEMSGIKIDLKKLKELKDKNEQNLKNISKTIFELTGEIFNINSSKQLSEILFNKLGLKAKKKTKTGYSTNESVLNDLKDEHLVIKEILKYREIYKLQSTYCEPLFKLANKNKNNLVFTNFLQTGTATGRLSSKNPNLQNIPVSYELGKDLRGCFIPNDGFSFISLDYSQIELRLLAHFSKDEKLLDAFKNDEDIHLKTALWLFKSGDNHFRSVAKSINFGLIYGMGATKLSDELKISKDLAKEYIEKYFLEFPSVKGFLQGLKQDAKENGFITTLFGRKRYFDFANANQREFAMYEREAINTKFQGSVADIIKKAMILINPFLNENIRLILQIHDELIFEIRDDLVDEFSIKFKDIMQNVVNLNVNLKTSLSIGKDWKSLK